MIKKKTKKKRRRERDKEKAKAMMRAPFCLPLRTANTRRAAAEQDFHSAEMK